MPEPAQTDAASLALMQLDPPEPISMLPETLAWKVVPALLLAVVVLFLWRRYQIYRKTLWKRQALALALEAKGLAEADTWFALIKRVQLVHRSKAELLKLDDGQLLALFPDLAGSVREALIAGHYQHRGRLSEEDNDALYDAFVRRLHELPVDAKGEYRIREKADV